MELSASSITISDNEPELFIEETWDLVDDVADFADFSSPFCESFAKKLLKKPGVTPDRLRRPLFLSLRRTLELIHGTLPDEIPRFIRDLSTSTLAHHWTLDLVRELIRIHFRFPWHSFVHTMLMEQPNDEFVTQVLTYSHPLYPHSSVLIFTLQTCPISPLAMSRFSRLLKPYRKDMLDKLFASLTLMLPSDQERGYKWLVNIVTSMKPLFDYREEPFFVASVMHTTLKDKFPFARLPKTIWEQEILKDAPPPAFCFETVLPVLHQLEKFYHGTSFHYHKTRQTIKNLFNPPKPAAKRRSNDDQELSTCKKTRCAEIN